MHRLQALFTHAIFISLCALALTYQTYQVLQLSVDAFVLLLVFLATCCSYNLYRLIGLFPFRHTSNRTDFFSHHISGITLMLLTGAGMLVLLLELPYLIEPAIWATVGTLLYCFPLLPLKRPHWFSQVGWVKTILLSGTWTYATVCLPLFSTGFSMNEAAWYLTGCRFFFMLILCIIFDRRDQEMDQLRSLGSIATSIRPVYLQWVSILSFILHGVCIILLASVTQNGKLAAAFFFTALVTAWLFRLANKTKNYWFYYFAVDGLMLLSAFSTFLTTI